MGTPIKYIATVSPVREVSLLGTADLSFWRDRLRGEDLSPAEIEGRAQLVISATDSKYQGIRFKELSIAVFVNQREDNPEHDAVYLTQAFNSSRLFAFCERTLFSTPYDHATPGVDVCIPASIQLAIDGAVVLRAAMAADTATSRRAPSRSGEDGWELPIFLSGEKRRSDAPGKVFFARITGHTQVYPLLAGTDSVMVTSVTRYPVFQWLIESGFAGREWVIRENATHARSKTFRRAMRTPFKPQGHSTFSSCLIVE